MANKKKLTEEQLKEIKILQASSEMLQKTKAEAEKRGRDSETIKLIDVAHQDIIAQMEKIDTDIAAETVKTTKKTQLKKQAEKVVVDNAVESTQSVYKILNDLKGTETQNSVNDFIVDSDDVQYDVISLPSNGECYENKISKLPVGYLTAHDENFITSPNLYRDGLIIDFLLKNKVLNKDFDIDSLVTGDADAIILFLRATSYGTEFPISVKDPQTGKDIDYTVDLSTLKTKEFKLKGDENGFFDYELPLSHDVVKFRFLTRKDEKDLALLSRLENDNGKVSLLSRISYELDELLENDSILTEDENNTMKTFVEKVNNWRDKVMNHTTVGFNKLITNRMEMNIVAVNGNYDREYIHKYLNNMRAKDSLSLRKYINDNEPGIDFEIEVERPMSLGGGSFKTFLEWGDTIFLNIA